MLEQVKSKGIIFLQSIFSTYYIMQLGHFTEELLPIIFIFFLLIFKHKLANLHKLEKWKRFLIYIYSCYIAFSLYQGDLIYNNINNELGHLEEICVILGGMFLFYRLFFEIYNFILQIGTLKCRYLKVQKKVVFIFSSLIFLICWLPCLLENYPGILISDSTWQWAQAAGTANLSNHHPILHTMFIRLAQRVCIWITGTLNAEMAVLIYSIMQMVLLACVFATVLVIVYSFDVDIIILLGILIYYAFFPMHAIFSIYMTKDVLFSMFVLLLTVLIWKNIVDKDWLDKPIHDILYLVVFIMVLCTRSNGFLVVLGTLLVCLILMKKYGWKKNLIFLLLLFVINCAYGNLIEYLEIEKPNIVESLGMPINQISRVVVQDRSLSPKDTELIEKVLPLDEIKESYNQYYADTIKFNSNFDSDEIVNNKIQYLRLWIKLFFKYPNDYLQSSMALTIGYWYPGVKKGCVSYDVEKKENSLQQIGVKAVPLLGNGHLYDKYIGVEVRNNWITSWLWSIGVMVIVMFYCILITILREKYEYICVFSPNLMLWLSLLVAAPSYCETRYIYSLFIAMPIYIALIYTILRKDKLTIK